MAEGQRWPLPMSSSVCSRASTATSCPRRWRSDRTRSEVARTTTLPTRRYPADDHSWAPSTSGRNVVIGASTAVTDVAHRRASDLRHPTSTPKSAHKTWGAPTSTR